MFSSLSEKLTNSIRKIRGISHLTEENMQEALRDIRRAFLDADVALPVVRQFIEEVKNKALGQSVLNSVSPGQMLVKIVHDELVEILGNTTQEIQLNTTPPAVILMAGLQGSGKTTSSAKLAKWLTEKNKKKILLASADIYRPAAIEQLKILAQQIGIDFFDSNVNQSPEEIAKAAHQHAKLKLYDVLIFDTAGRLHIDQDMMDEIKQLHQILKPIETLFVVDSMTGQDAVNTAKTFNESLDLTGVILTKTDGDSRGGVALSVKLITGKPIKFIGTGEKVGGFEAFHPDRIASRILDMGDIVTLVEEMEQKLDREKIEKFNKKFKKGQDFDLEDFREQLLQMKKMGGIMGLMSKLPGMGNLPTDIKNKINDDPLKKIEAIINSMTAQERRFPALLKNSRKLRIAKGSGTQVQDINKLLKQFEQMQKMMKKFSKGGNMMKMMRNFSGGMMMP